MELNGVIVSKEKSWNQKEKKASTKRCQLFAYASSTPGNLPPVATNDRAFEKNVKFWQALLFSQDQRGRGRIGARRGRGTVRQLACSLRASICSALPATSRARDSLGGYVETSHFVTAQPTTCIRLRGHSRPDRAREINTQHQHEQK